LQYVLRNVVTVSPADERSVPVLALLVSLSLVPLLIRKPAGLWATAAIAGRVMGVVLLYVGWHAAAARLMPAPAETSNVLGWVLVGLGFVGLFAVKATLQVLPQGRLARGLYPWLFAGLYLDERFTRLTFRVWPPRFQRPLETSRAVDLQKNLEAQT